MPALLGGALFALLTITPAAVYGTQTASGTTPRGALGSATSALATPLKTGVSYQGAVSRRNKALWYRLDGAGAKRIIFHVRGKSRTCAVRASLLDARGRPLGQLITSPNETLPFVVLIPARAVSDTYYLRLDANPFASCLNAGYVFTLLTPEQPAPCEVPQTPPAEQTTKSCPTGPVTQTKAPAPTSARARLAVATSDCERIGPTLWRATVAVAKERSRVFHRRASIVALRRLERKRRALARRVYRVCTEPV